MESPGAITGNACPTAHLACCLWRAPRTLKTGTGHGRSCQLAPTVTSSRPGPRGLRTDPKPGLLKPGAERSCAAAALGRRGVLPASLGRSRHAFAVSLKGVRTLPGGHCWAAQTPPRKPAQAPAGPTAGERRQMFPHQPRRTCPDPAPCRNPVGQVTVKTASSRTSSF